MNSKEKDVISILDLILKRALRSKKATGTRLFLLKAMIDLGSGWHTTREILQKLSTYDKSLPRKIDHIFELASHYPELVQTDVSDGLPLKDRRGGAIGWSRPPSQNREGSNPTFYGFISITARL